MNTLICGDFNKIALLMGVIKRPLESKANENGKSFFPMLISFGPQLRAAHLSRSGGKFYKASAV